MNTDQSDLIVQKTATVALAYYPEIAVDAPEFSLWDEVGYCLEHLDAGDLDDEVRLQLRAVVARTIIDPTKHREELSDLLFDLTRADDEPGPALDSRL